MTPPAPSSENGSSRGSVRNDEHMPRRTALPRTVRTSLWAAHGRPQGGHALALARVARRTRDHLRVADEAHGERRSAVTCGENVQPFHDARRPHHDGDRRHRQERDRGAPEALRASAPRADPNRTKTRSEDAATSEAAGAHGLVRSSANDESQTRSARAPRDGSVATTTRRSVRRVLPFSRRRTTNSATWATPTTRMAVAGSARAHVVPIRATCAPPTIAAIRSANIACSRAPPACDCHTRRIRSTEGGGGIVRQWCTLGPTDGASA